MELFGKSDHIAIAEHVGTRSAIQIRSHAQKHFLAKDKGRDMKMYEKGGQNSEGLSATPGVATPSTGPVAVPEIKISFNHSNAHKLVLPSPCPVTTLQQALLGLPTVDATGVKWVNSKSRSKIGIKLYAKVGASTIPLDDDQWTDELQGKKAITVFTVPVLPKAATAAGPSEPVQPSAPPEGGARAVKKRKR